MCIIAYKPKDVNPPSEKILRNCFSNNSDGVGIAIQRNGKITINKFMEEIPFIAYAKQNVRKEDSIIYHFRIATHGSVDLENTHPFIITKDWQEMGESQSITTKNILAHNGIITSLADDHTKSDSKILAHLLAEDSINSNLFQSEGIKVLIQALIETDKLVVMNKEGKCFLIGNFEKDKGIYYSNLTYRYKKYWNYYYPEYVTPYSGDYISKKQSKKRDREAKKQQELDLVCYPVTNEKCAYCNTEEDIYYFWDIEENLCITCYKNIYEV